MFKYNDGGEIIEIIVRESSGAKIESYKFQTTDTKRASSIFKTVMKKYGITDKSDMDWMKKL